MRIEILFGLLGTGVAFASRQGPLNSLRTSCGTTNVPPHLIEASQELAILENAQLASRLSQRRATKEVKVDTYVHVLAENKTEEGGWVTEIAVKNQLKLLNKAFDSAKFHFVLKDIDYTIYHNWDTTEIIDTGDITFGPDLSIKKKLRKGDYKTLNVYFVYGLGVHNLSGVVFSPSAWATPPNKTDKGSDTFWRDGVQVQTNLIAGGSGVDRFGYNGNVREGGVAKGNFLMHEVGHWLGLLHTFQWAVSFTFPCDGPGDYVDDTPQELWTYNCDEIDSISIADRDTCPDNPGIDNPGNFMTNIGEWCMELFTPGQIRRMHSFWELYRKGKKGEYWYIGS